MISTEYILLSDYNKPENFKLRLSNVDEHLYKEGTHSFPAIQFNK